MSADEQNVLAIVKSSENDDNLSASLSPVFSEINELYASGNIKNFFGSDMKFMQICLGLWSSTGEYACPWCKVHKKDRGDMSKPWDFYHLTGNVRTINEIKDIYNGKKPVTALNIYLCCQ